MAARDVTFQGSTMRWKKFLKEVRAELKKVSWPNKKELLNYSAIVFVTVFVVAALIAMLDGALSWLLQKLLW